MPVERLRGEDGDFDALCGAGRGSEEEGEECGRGLQHGFLDSAMGKSLSRRCGVSYPDSCFPEANNAIEKRKHNDFWYVNHV
jgi:hypothetical protein